MYNKEDLLMSFDKEQLASLLITLQTEYDALEKEHIILEDRYNKLWSEQHP